MILNINTYPRCVLAAMILGSAIMFAILATDAARNGWIVCTDFNHYHEGKLEYIMIVIAIFMCGYIIGKFSRMLESGNNEQLKDKRTS